MPARKGAGAFLLGLMRSSLFSKFVIGLFVVVSILSVFFSPLNAAAAALEDPTGRGWTCEGDLHRESIYHGVEGPVGTITCHPPGDTSRTWQQRCTENNDVAEELGFGSKALDCRVCTTENGSQTCAQGDWVSYEGWGGQYHSVALDGTTGMPTGDVQDGEPTNLFTEPLDALGDVALETVATIIWFITEVLVWVADFLLSVTGGFFNFIITEFVIQMAKYITAPEATAVRTAWTLIRDLANIGIIGGLVATAIGTIIGSSKINIQGTLARLILAALLVNFSYFFAGAIIDFSNFTAKAAYDSLVVTPDCGNDCGIASRIAKISHLDTDFNQVLNGAATPLVNATRDTETPSWADQVEIQRTLQPSAMATINIMYLVFVCITTFVFLSAIALLVGRFVVLIFLLVTSPIGIAGGAVPLLSKYSKEWWDALWNQALFAPVYFVLAGIALNILTQFNNTLLGAGYATTIETINDTSGATVDSLQQIIGIVAMFTVSIGFMWAALSIAKSMSEKGSSYFKPIYGAAQKAFGWLPKQYVEGLKFGGALALRNTVGRGAERLSIKWKEVAANRGLANNPLTAGFDRAFQKALDKTKDQKFFGKAGYQTVKTEREAREVALDEERRKEEQLGKITGHFHGDQKKQLEDLRKKQSEKTLTADEERELAELEGKLTTSDAERLKYLENRDKKFNLSDKEKAELEALKQKRARGALNLAQEKRLEELKKQKILGGLTEDEHKNLKDLEDIEKGGILKKVEDGQKIRAEEFKNAQRQRRKDGTEESDEEYAERQKARGEYGVQGELVDARDKDGNVILGPDGKPVKVWEPAEDLTAYWERLDEVSGLKKAIGEGESIVATLPADFVHHEYEKNPNNLIKYAPFLNPTEYMGVMKDPKVRRGIKDAMRNAKHGEYIDMIKDIDARIKSGELVKGTPEYSDALSVPYYYNLKKMRSKEEFFDLITSDVGEELRNKDFFWNGGSLTGMYLDAQPKFGANERRAIAAMKREAYLGPQRRLTASYIMQGLNDEYHVPNVGGSDRYSARKEALDNANKEIKYYEGVVAAGKAPPHVLEEVKIKLKYAQMSRDAIENDNYESVFERNYQGQEAQDNARRAAKARAQALHQQVLNKEKSTLEAMQEAERDEELFLTYNEVVAEQGMADFMEGKNGQEEMGMVSMERSYSPATVMGKGANDIAQMMAGWDIRFKKSNRRAFVVEKEDSEIQLLTNDNLLEKFGGWPTRAEIDEANKLRERKYGKLYDPNDESTFAMIDDPDNPGQKIHDPNQRMQLPYSVLDLGTTVKQTRRGQA